LAGENTVSRTVGVEILESFGLGWVLASVPRLIKAGRDEFRDLDMLLVVVTEASDKAELGWLANTYTAPRREAIARLRHLSPSVNDVLDKLDGVVFDPQYAYLFVIHLGLAIASKLPLPGEAAAVPDRLLN
jgi:hypothetical protein